MSQLLNNIVHYHHELIDGSGYPERLAGDAIPVEARIVCVADVFDALTSPRPYKSAWSNETAFDYLEQNAGSKFDPDCVDALFQQRSAIEATQQRFGGSLH